MWVINVGFNHTTVLISPLGKWATIGLLNMDSTRLGKLKERLQGMVFKELNFVDKPKQLTKSQEEALAFIQSRVRA
jgi:hypothetical protein